MPRKPLSWKVEPQQDVTWVGLSGEITEASDFTPLVSQVSGVTAVMDLAEISRINSSGIRQWINFVTALTRSGSRLTLQRCSPPVVAQLNMSTDFARGAVVRSVLAPYFCTGCKREYTREIALDDQAPTRLLEPYACPECGAECELDDLPDFFLSFQARHQATHDHPR
jgi:anti-anti-sigma regulatory factor/DNA-directed RNA polymerase subunit RPC12/RpoP